MEISEHNDSGDYMQLMEGTHRKKDELKLDMSASFLSSIRLMVAGYRNGSIQIKDSDTSKYEELETAESQLIGKNSNKRVPTELPLLTLSVGNKEFIRTDDCDIFARFYYQQNKVVCQTHNGTLSKKVEVSFSDITSLRVCFDHREFDTLRIEAKFSFKSFSADNPRPGMLPNWKVEDPNDVDHFLKSKFVFFKIEKGMLEKGFAKLLYNEPQLERVMDFSRGTSGDQHGRVSAQMQQTNVSALHSLPSNIAFPYIGGTSLVWVYGSLNNYELQGRMIMLQE